MATATGQEAGRPQPQTTGETGGPFLRHTQSGRAPQYVAAQAFSSILTQPLVARPGYFKSLRINHTASGGSVTGGTVAADAPFSLNSLISLKDAFGTPLITADGWSVSQLIQMLSGGFGVGNFTNIPQQLPSFSGLTTSSNGNFSYSYALPFEFAKCYGVLSAANASLLPTLSINSNSFASLYSSAPTITTTPTVQTTVSSDFYWLPEGVNVEPPGLGTTRQFIQQQLNPTVQSATSARLQFPRMGGYLDSISVIARDSTGARNDVWPSGNNRLQFYVDGVPLLDTSFNELVDDMNIQFGFNGGSNIAGTNTGVGSSTLYRPTGVISISRKTSLNQQNLGLLDTGEAFLSTNPGTLLELNAAPWGTFSNGPATLTALIGQVVPTGALVTGIPEA